MFSLTLNHLKINDMLLQLLKGRLESRMQNKANLLLQELKIWMSP